MIKRLKQLTFFQSEIANVHAAALILGGAGLLSRVLGVLRDRMLAARFGAGRELDIYTAAFNIPDFMSVLFLLGGATAVILPVFQERLMQDPKKARDFISALAALFFVGASVVCAGAFFAVPRIIPFIVPGFSPEEQATTAFLTRLMLLSPILLGMSGIFSVIIQSFQRFAVYALAPILYNIGIIFGIFFLVPHFGIAGVAMGVVIGALLHAGLQFQAAALAGFPPRLIRTLIRLPSTVRLLADDIRTVALTAVPRVFSVSLTQLTLIALNAIGSTLAPGSVAVLSLAQNLYFVPVGIFGVSYATAVFPRMARAASARAASDFSYEFAVGVRSILFWTAPSAALFIVLRAHIVRAALGAGAFSWEDTRLTAAVLAALSIAMVAGALQTLFIRVFYALGNTWIPLALNAGASLISIGLAFFLAQSLATGSGVGRMLTAAFRIEDLAHPEVLGLGIGFAAGLLLNVGMLYICAVAYEKKVFGKGTCMSGRDAMSIIGATIVAGSVAYVVRSSFAGVLPLITFARVLTQGVIAGSLGWAAYFAVLTFLGSQDTALLRRIIARRLFSLRILPQYWDGSEIK
ncbi:MAG: hypothetical protein A3J58_00580 [Candidatus Sungbacteria bacterium RIFCSPHIGHO2_02_FULL_52_23]|uniref:Lipid II flippase MurJ n=1 Tax=Candidatus Sungbacteria bacterium RIFCSPHIGHO2_02_FULL_52_23 TaxID=1802274 RepID=A0A1G2KS88_9BACT|nr:MAG: hypothetical protein A3J58_00580 [Candidatus Sungbacteria bacterium RIFCSPHIGHO2_02_FULL_52_23]